jgi:hypothetical protein
MRFESRRGPKRENKGKKSVLQVGKFIYLLIIFTLLLFLLHFRNDFLSLR